MSSIKLPIFWYSHAQGGCSSRPALLKGGLQQRNVMPRIRRGSNFHIYAALYCSCLGFTAILASPRYKKMQKGQSIQEGSNKVLWYCLSFGLTNKPLIHHFENYIQFWGIFQAETLFQKLWPLLYKRAELELRSTNHSIQQ